MKKLRREIIISHDLEGRGRELTTSKEDCLLQEKNPLNVKASFIGRTDGLQGKFKKALVVILRPVLIVNTQDETQSQGTVQAL